MKSPFDLDWQNSSTDDKIVVALERLSQVFRVLLWQECKQHSLSPIQIQLLIFLLYHTKEKRKVTYLAKEFNMTKATISDSIKVMADKELITKEYEMGDSRSYVINLTQKGNDIARQTSTFTNELQKPLEKLDGSDKQKLLLNLFQLINHLNQVGVLTVQRMCFSCMHYRKNKDGQEHYCMLLNKKLKVTDLRIDCPEHLLETLM